MALDNAGNTLGAAKKLNLTSTTQTFTDFVGASDLNDFYNFGFNSRSSLSLNFTSLSADADIQIVQDRNSNGIFDGLSEVIGGSYFVGTAIESLTMTADVGNYFIRVFSPMGANTNYNLGVSATPVTPTDLAGNTLATARQITVGSTSASFSDWIGTADTNDYYRFTVNQNSNFNLNLTGLSGDADVHLLDINGSAIATSLNGGSLNEVISRQLNAGTYFIRVYPMSGVNTNYNLGVSSTPITSTDLAGNTLATARQITVGSTSASFSDWIGTADTNDYYRFTVNQNSNFNLNLTGLSGDADVHLLDINGSAIATSLNGGSLNEVISRQLNAGTYFIRVYPMSGVNTNYNLGVSATPVSTNIAPNSLAFYLRNQPVANDGTLNILDARVYDTNGVRDISVIDFQIFQNGSLVNSVSSDLLGTSIVAYSSDNRWGSFSHHLSLAGLNLGAGSYTLRGVARDMAGATSNIFEQAFSLIIPPAAPTSLAFNINNLTISNTGTLNITGGRVFDANGVRDISAIDFQVFQNGALVNSVSSDVLGTSLIADTSDNRWGSFSHNLSLAGLNLGAGSYTLRAVARDIAGAVSTAIDRQFSIIANIAPTNLQFGLEKTTYNNTETLRIINGQVFDGNGALDISRIDFQIFQNGVLVNSVSSDVLGTSLVADTNDNRWGSFNHSISIAGFDVTAGNYTLRAVARDSIQQQSNIVEREFNIDLAGNTLATARQLGIGTGTVNPRDWVGSLDTNDYYRFTLNQNSNFNLSLNSLIANADVELLDSSNVAIARSTNTGNLSEAIIRQLDAGTYFIRVYSGAGFNTNYNLGVFATPIINLEPGNTLSTAEVRNSAIFSRNEIVSTGDRDDFYRFNVSQSGIFTANLTGLTGDADVKLIHDMDSDGVIDQGEIIAWQWERGNASESIRRFLNAGNYFLQVMSYNNQTANYSLSTNFTAAASDDQRFSFQLNFGSGFGGFSSAAINAIREAASFWERVITHRSSVTSSSTLTIDIAATVLGAGYENTLAYAGPTLGLNATGTSRAISGGSSTINTKFLSTYNANPNYLRDIMIHEFAHVLGIGTLWESTSVSWSNGTTSSVGKNLINRSTATYNANTYAGWAYGEMSGTFTQTAVPVEDRIFGHWDESRFDHELMTPLAEGSGAKMPLSQLTIASLRDIGWNVNYGAAEAYLLPSSSVNQTQRITTNSVSSTNSSFQISCGCAKHIAGRSLNMIGSTSLESLINGHAKA